jgi:hypothetical protein
MKRRADRSSPTLQLNLPMLSVPLSALPDGTRTDLVLALVELLVEAASPSLKASREGGADEYKAHS